MAAIAATLGIASYAVSSAGSFALTQRTDPSLGTLQRNRYIVAGLVAIGGVALAMKYPLVGVGLAAGGAASAFGTPATLALGKILDKPPTAKIGAYEPMAAVYAQDMRAIGAYEPMAAVYGQDMRGYQALQGVGAVYGNDMRGIGDFMPAPPWSGTPFG